jgi:hypothetical protein
MKTLIPDAADGIEVDFLLGKGAADAQCAKCGQKNGGETPESVHQDSLSTRVLRQKSVNAALAVVKG